MSSVNKKKNQLQFFLKIWLSLLSFSFLNALTRNSSIILNTSDKSLVRDLRGKMMLSVTIKYDNSCGFLISALYQVEESPFYFQFVQCGVQIIELKIVMPWPVWLSWLECGDSIPSQVICLACKFSPGQDEYKRQPISVFHINVFLPLSFLPSLLLSSKVNKHVPGRGQKKVIALFLYWIPHFVFQNPHHTETTVTKIFFSYINSSSTFC